MDREIAPRKGGGCLNREQTEIQESKAKDITEIADKGKGRKQTEKKEPVKTKGRKQGESVCETKKDIGATAAHAKSSKAKVATKKEVMGVVMKFRKHHWKQHLKLVLRF